MAGSAARESLDTKRVQFAIWGYMWAVHQKVHGHTTDEGAVVSAAPQWWSNNKQLGNKSLMDAAIAAYLKGYVSMHQPSALGYEYSCALQ